MQRTSVCRIFLSTPSARRATGWLLGRPVSSRISIHALREEGDKECKIMDNIKVLFLSTPSARRATFSIASYACNVPISIHALREEGDLKALCWFPHRCNFYPRPPRGGRPVRNTANVKPCDFYPRPPRGGRRSSAAHSPISGGYFYPRPPRGGRRAHFASG